jgi:hypothetical protein
MSVEGATRENACSRFVRGRLVGAAAIALAASVVIDNTVVSWAGTTTYAASIKEVLAFHAGADWSRLAVAAGATFSAVMAFYAVLWDGVVLSAGELTEPSPVLELAWQMHGAAFAWSMPALGTTFIGAALAAHASGLTPAWQRLLGLVGGSLLLAAGLGNLAIADGSALIFVGLLGFAAWLVWLLATGVRLVRSDVD